MKRTLKKGFTLIELMVVIAIIGILATTLAPKLREQLAKAKDSKAISLLGASRTVAGALIIDSTINNESADGKSKVSGSKIYSQLDVKAAGLLDITHGTIIVGGSKDSASNDKMSYGGQIVLNVTTSGTTPDSNGYLALSNETSAIVGSATCGTLVIIDSANDLHLSVVPTGTTSVTSAKDKSTEGKLWFAY